MIETLPDGRFRIRVEMPSSFLGRKRKYKTLPKGTTKKEAKKIDAEMMLKYVGYKKKGDFTVGDILEKYMDFHRLNVEKTTVKQYECIINKHYKPFLEVKADKLTTQDIQNIMTQIVSDGLSKGRVLRVKTILQNAYKYAKKLKMVVDNPCEDAVVPGRMKKKKTNIFTPEELDKIFIRLKKSPPYYDLVYLALATGLRRGELFGLLWEDINFENKTLSVNKSLVEVKEGKPHWGSPKTDAGWRTIALSNNTCGHLKKMLEKQNKYCDMLNGKLEFVICTPELCPRDPSSMAVYFKKIISSLDIDGSFHTLRHTHASVLLYEGADMKYVSERLGHKNILVTYNTYSHLLPDAPHKTIKNLDNYLPLS